MLILPLLSGIALAEDASAVEAEPVSVYVELLPGQQVQSAMASTVMPAKPRR